MNTPSDEYDSYREYRAANTNKIMYSRMHFFSEAINFIRQCSKLFHTLALLTNFFNLFETFFFFSSGFSRHLGSPLWLLIISFQ